MAEELLQRLLAATTPEEKAALVARSVLENEELVLAELVPVLAFLRWFDEPVVAALLPECERARSAAHYARLLELPFVERVTYGYALHDLTRQGLLVQATSEQRRVAAQAALAFVGSKDESSLLEALYCTVLGEGSEEARQLLEDQIYLLGGAENYSGFAPLFAALDEAESLVGAPVIEPSPWLWMSRGTACYIQGDLAGAIDYYDKAIILDPHDALVYGNRGNARYKQGDLPGAITDYSRAIQLLPNGTDKAAVFISRGAALYRHGDLGGAKGDFDNAIAIDPESSLAYHNRGVVRRALGEHQAAISDFDSAIALDSDDATAYHNRGVAHRALEEYQAAISDFDSAIALNPKYAAAYNNRAILRSRRGDLAGAIDDYDKAIQFFSDEKYKAAAYNHRGNNRRAQGDLSGAMADYENAITLNPQYSLAYYNRGNARLIQGDLPGAISDYVRAITRFLLAVFRH